MDSAVEVYRSTRPSECQERSLVLEAVGIASSMRIESAFCVLIVEQMDSERAREQLTLYERERRPSTGLPPAPPLYANAWLGCALYTALLILTGLAVTNGWLPSGAFDAGTLAAGPLRAGQWWRAWTALTLHLDGMHLLANLVGGSWFGYLAGRQQGAGHAWLMITTGAAAANLLEGLLAPSAQRTVGASTAVFTALGLLCAYSWGSDTRWARTRALQWAPLVGGVVLLGWFGSGDAANPGEVDLVAHVLGFVAGIVLGVIAARTPVQQRLQRVPQWTSGLIALAQIAAAWYYAIRITGAR